MLKVLGEPIYLTKYYETARLFIRWDIVSDLGIQIENPILEINNDFNRLIGR